MEHLAQYIPLTFGLTTVITILLFGWTMQCSEATRKKGKWIVLSLFLWMFVQAVLTRYDIYNTDTDSFPPKIMLFGIFPMLLSIVLLFATVKGRQFIDSLSLERLTYLNTIRIPVEIVLYWLFVNKTIPELMTFSGINFDILAGFTAPIVGYFGFTKPKISRRAILIWNFVSLGLLLNIVICAVLSTPSPIQKLAFDQPNIAILNFPFSWLPTVIVPIVLLGHLTVIRQLLKEVFQRASKKYTIESGTDAVGIHTDYLIFGIFKSGDYRGSYTIYKVTDTGLWADTREVWHSERFKPEGYVFKGKPLSLEKWNKAKELINTVPQELLTADWDSFYSTGNKNEDKLVLAFGNPEFEKTISIDDYVIATEKLPIAVRNFRRAVEKLVKEL
ncbi:hypothetical protein [Flavobacterium supellecticarium]|uniref:hypothetical protein n=1 Tax=Flavobacterium supellecticarium TaxID=2565924 RepID=UPI001B3B2C3F|nr:hypothetical protein [Flavobacterium supellecticarium]